MLSVFTKSNICSTGHSTSEKEKQQTQNVKVCGKMWISALSCKSHVHTDMNTITKNVERSDSHLCLTNFWMESTQRYALASTYIEQVKWSNSSYLKGSESGLFFILRYRLKTFSLIWAMHNNKSTEDSDSIIHAVDNWMSYHYYLQQQVI